MVVKITQPKDREDISVGELVKFVGTADGDVVRVELSAEGRWNLGQSSVTSGNWSITYPAFTRAGTRNIIARAFDNANSIVARDDVWIDVNPATIDLDIQLTPNFSLREFVMSTTADRLRIDNTPTVEEIDHLRTLCEDILQPARDALGPLKITSGFRSEALNRAVGGEPNSAHRLGYAADVVPINVGTKQLAEWIVQKIPGFDQVILEFGSFQSPNWIHVSAEPRNRRQILRISSGGTISLTSGELLS